MLITHDIPAAKSPGQVLKEDFMDANKINDTALSQRAKISKTLISLIIRGHRRITADTAVKLSAVFGNQPMYWLVLQANHDLSTASVCDGSGMVAAS